MCGIVGYIGQRQALDILIDGLEKLEYRGYDSSGIAIHTEEGLQICKSQGRLQNLKDKVIDQPLSGIVGIGHTRWATHGKPSDINAHPHRASHIALVHNGIIENYAQLKEWLKTKGHMFESETDTEVLAHLIAHYDTEKNVEKAVQLAIAQVRGSFALAVVSEYEPDCLVAVRQASPLIIGAGKNEFIIGSDIPALLAHTREVYILDDGEMAVITKGDIKFSNLEGKSITREMIHVDWDVATAEKDGYEHFMLKEIHEQPKAYVETMRGNRNLHELSLTPEKIKQINRIHIVACGTAFHAGLIGKPVLETCAKIPVEVDIASEYRYRSPLIDVNTLVIVVSQSGETADTLAALREAKKQGAFVLAITNVVGSSVAREANATILTLAGPEIAVASTKAYSSQLIAFYLLGLHFAEVLKTQTTTWIDQVRHEIERLSEKVKRILESASIAKIKEIAEHLTKSQHLFFIGRGVDFAVAQEGSLKLKEISYLHSEAYAAGELKHGTLALIEEGIPVVSILTQPNLLEKTVSNVKEVKARGAYAIAIVDESHQEEVVHEMDQWITIPSTHPLLTTALAVIPLQLIAYYAALFIGNDVDKPRNLAKSVTVE